MKGAKLTANQVREIRQDDDFVPAEAAAKYGVSVGAVYAARTGINWKALDVPPRPVEDRRKTHGGSYDLTYQSWFNMLNRCNNPDATQYRWYGGKGVKVCERWKDYAAFLADVGARPSKKHTLDRYPDKDGDYEPGNVRWATQSEQCRNRSSNRAVWRSDGVRFDTLAEAADAVGGTCGGVSAACRGTQKTHCGYGWVYA